MKHIVFAWPELPDYGARQIAAVINLGNVRVSVIATRPSVPINGMEESLGQTVHWVDANSYDLNWQHLGLEQPDLMFIGGWTTPSFDSLAKLCKRAKIPVVLMCDNAWKDNLLHKIIDPLRHRLFYRRRYDAVFVPGQSGERYVRHLGYPASRIRQGLYGIDARLFELGPAMNRREKVMIYVGQFIERKNVLALTRAFARFADDYPDWTLRLFGSGPLRHSLTVHSNIVVNDFVQPRDIAKQFQSSRVLVLPSLREHWALVIHEAALSGCALALSDVNGSISELASAENSVIYTTGSEVAIEDALRQFAIWDEAQWEQARLKSHEYAIKFGPSRFASVVRELLTTLLPTRAAD